jgi:hypothetical protein
MGCNCGDRRRAKAARAAANGDPVAEIMGGYKYLSPKQVRARIEVYKRRNCQKCDNRYKCDYDMFVSCKGTKPKM